MTTDLNHAAQKIEAAGYTAKVWRDRRVYVRQGSRELGYITEDDLSGGTGTCKSIARSGHIARILRSESV